jgi:hypothetical protein
MGRGDHLDLRLQKLGRDSALARLLGIGEECLRHVAGDHLVSASTRKILFFDSEGERAGHAWTLLLRSVAKA